jgi:insulysin
VLLDLFTQSASRPCFHELRTRQRLGYSVSLHASTLQRVVALAVRVQSPGTDPAGLGERIGAWLAAFRGQLEGMPQEELENHKRVGLWGYVLCIGSIGSAVGSAGVAWGFEVFCVLRF